MLKSHFNIAHTETEVVEEEQEQEVDVVEETEIPERSLNKSEISVRLSLLGKTAEGDGYTYLKCKITGLKMTRIDAIKGYRHLMFLDVSNNYLDINALQIITELPYLILIQADGNRLTSAGLKQMKYLQCIICNNNQITSVNDVFQEQLSTLELADNKITSVDFATKMPTLRVLDFRFNQIKDISNFNFPNLDSLYLAGNKITTLAGLETCVNLRILHVRNNPIKLLNGFDEAHTKLQYINLRNCKVGTLRQIKKLRVLTALETLTLKGCPYFGGTGGEDDDDKDAKDEEDDPQLRVEVLAVLPRLKRLNKDMITPEERQECKELIATWAEEGEKEEEEEIEDEQMMEEASAVED
ncbi:leucine-rich repeat-containing protein 23-like [Helicoverpa zea]|uniref:leucine-rich repeat-containing protein 23-like n=1 Tax=Helicoverpa zea TaxID=7113 RepID=UPI001F593CD8|nr:leucine-rich repeat-containing protein 23-like [Helicoverpa zea]